MIAFVFPGQGSQKVGMGADLIETYDIARSVFEQADSALGFSIKQICLNGPADKLQLTEHSQPAILTMSVAILRVIETETGLKPDIVAGHSLGEYSALVASGALSFDDAVRLVNKRGQFMQAAVPVGQGSMAALGAVSEEEAQKLCNEAAQGQVLCPANYNSPRQIVIAGHTEAVKRAVELVKERRGIAKELPVSAPFHCPLMKPAAEQLAGEIERTPFRDATVPIIANVDAKIHKSADDIKRLLVEQVTASVQWIKSIRELHAKGTKQVFELGPGRALSGLVRQIAKELPATPINSAESVTKIRAEWPKEVEETHDDGRQVTEDGKVVWPDGMQWDPNKPGAHGF